MRVPEEWLPRFGPQGSRPYRTRLTGRLALSDRLSTGLVPGAQIAWPGSLLRSRSVQSPSDILTLSGQKAKCPASCCEGAKGLL
jgi:hypothetical protein